MSVSSRLLIALGTFARMKARRRRRKFLNRCENCADTQRRVLRDLLRLNRGTDFARDHRLDPKMSIDEFRRTIGVCNYEMFVPYLQRVREGQTQALLGRENKILMFALSSGTTSESKYIPITRRFLSDYRRGWQIWGIHAIDQHPGIDSGHILQSTSSENRFRTPGGTPCGNISGLVTAMQNRVVRKLYTLPPQVCKIEDPESKYYTAVRLAAADPEVTWITTANPATLLQIAKLLDRHKESLIRDIRDGSLSSPYPMSHDERRLVQRATKRANKRRAQELDRWAEQHDRLLPSVIWPRLMLLSVWTGGSAGAYCKTVRELYGDIPIRDHGLHASEGRMTIPFQDSSTAGILDVTSHFFEFIPEVQIDDANPDVLLAHELEVGRNYFILLTTSSGLYRYDIRDVVRCVGYHATTPMLEFLHKGASISSITGEKIAESQVVRACRDTSDALAVPLPQFTLAPVWGDPPSYRLLLERSDASKIGSAERFATEVDARLQQLNCEYEEKRRSTRLGAMEAVLLPEGAWTLLSRQRTQRQGSSIEQYKHPCLVPDHQFLPRFLEQLAELPTGPRIASA